MKKLLVLLMAFILTLALVGCGGDKEDLLTETFYEDGVHMTVEYAIVDGKATYMTVCELYDDECETNYPKVTEKTYLTSDRETIVAELKNYIEMMEALYDELT